MPTDEERIALFIDHENLVLGAREIGRSFDVGPIMEALAERGRVVARRAYADWTLFADDRRSLVEHNCELIDIPQRTGTVRKNAADIKLAVDAMELAYERSFVSTFVIASGDSDFTPLVAALRALNRRVIGIGVKGSTSGLLPPACDEFMFYDRLPGVSEPAPARQPKGNGNKGRAPAPAIQERERGGGKTRGNGGRDLQDLQRVVTQTLAGLKQSGTEPVLASSLKRAVLRKDPTFSESDYGFRAFGELLRQLERNGVISLAEGQAPGDPAVDFPDTGQSAKSFEILRSTVLDLQGDDGEVPLSGLKDQIRKRIPTWSEKDLGYAGFLQFVKAAASSGVVTMEWDDDEGDYFLYVPE
jgi:NYN domain/OST-HTH/LOTUS domain